MAEKMDTGWNPRWNSDFEQRQKQRAEWERRQYVALTLEVGECGSCGGKIMYLSEWVPVHTGIFALTSGPQQEVCKCACSVCGILYNTEMPRYRDPVERYRKMIDD